MLVDLVAKRLQRSFGVLGEVGRRSVWIPFRAKEIRSEMFDGFFVVVPLEDFQSAELGAYRLKVIRFQDDSCLVVGSARPGVDLPLALHLEVRVDAGRRGADEQVLATADDLVDRLAWQYPMMKLLMASPAVQTLRWVGQQFPVLRAPSIVDPHPRMQPAHSEWREWLGKHYSGNP